MMTEERKPDASSQPSFAERVAEVDRRAIEAKRCGAVANQTDTQTVLDLLACIREQQAALESIENWRKGALAYDADTGNEPREFCEDVELIENAARAVLAKWRIE